MENMGDRQGSDSQLTPESNLKSGDYDGILFVATPTKNLRVASKFGDVVSAALKIDPSLESEVAILSLPDLPAGRLVYAPTGKLDPDYDDVRVLKQAAARGVKRAHKANIKNLLVVLEEYPQFENSQLVTLLGVLEAVHVPLQARENRPSKHPKFAKLGVYTGDDNRTKQIVNLARTLNDGLNVARDIGNGDPERMTPSRVQQYVQEVFSKTSIKISVVDDPQVIAKEYPLFEAVNRAASVVERHRGRIIYLEYSPPEKVTESLFLVGKGVTYDTGGADIKAGGIMAGMSRDKCGAAAVAGFMKIVANVKPKNVKVVAALSMVRNSVGSNGYVADEIIVSRSGAVVRVGNTDAEGRMIMADVLCRMKELAVDSVNPHLFTIATLTGHARLAVGFGYSIAIDNGPARKNNFSTKLQKQGEVIGDPIEISTLRREDLAFHKGKVESEDVMQCCNAPSSRTDRGHQGPAGFLVLASGLDKHGSRSEKPLLYSHLDIAASAGDHPHPATGAPILALANTFLLH